MYSTAFQISYTMYQMCRVRTFIVYDVCALCMVYYVHYLIYESTPSSSPQPPSYRTRITKCQNHPNSPLRDSTHTFAEHMFLHRMPISVILQACRICLRLC
nr:TPA: hypothetical protein [Oryctes rhinoceros nudivirus]